MAKTYQLTTGTRVANAVLGTMLRAGLGPKPMRLLSTTGRKTGRVRTTPVVPVEHGGRRWLVSPFGEVGWVRNARASGHAWLRRGRSSEEVAVSEVEPTQAIPVLRRYLSAKPTGQYVRSYFDVRPDSADAAFAAEAPRHPVFEIHTFTDHDKDR